MARSVFSTGASASARSTGADLLPGLDATLSQLVASGGLQSSGTSRWPMHSPHSLDAAATCCSTRVAQPTRRSKRRWRVTESATYDDLLG